jgi:uncharacterized damage-inducible protein DinB
LIDGIEEIILTEKNLRENLIEILSKEAAHVTVSDAIENLNPENRNKRPADGIHSVWEELEHMRITQEDILQYTLDPSWKSPEWPEKYWPGNISVSDEMWNNSVSKFNSDLEKVLALINDPDIDLTSEIPHGEGRTYLREILLIIAHNAYHCGQIVMTRKLLDDWK